MMCKAITICQPYADLIMRGEKRVENRTWFTRYRGTLYIHAGKSRAWLTEPATPEMRFGAIVAMATLVDCVSIEKIGSGELDLAYPWIRTHAHTNGPWCWILEHVSAVGPWPWIGSQGLWNIQDVEVERARAFGGAHA